MKCTFSIPALKFLPMLSQNPNTTKYPSSSSRHLHLLLYLSPTSIFIFFTAPKTHLHLHLLHGTKDPSPPSSSWHPINTTNQIPMTTLLCNKQKPKYKPPNHRFTNIHEIQINSSTTTEATTGSDNDDRR